MTNPQSETFLASLHPLERKVLPHLQKEGTLGELAKAAGLQEVEAMRALQWLANKGVVEISTKEEQVLTINEKGRKAAQEGLPEEHALRALKERGQLAVKELAKVLPAYDKSAVGPVTGKLKRLGIPFITTKEGKPAFKWIELPIPSPPARRLLAEAAKRGWRITITAPDDALRDLLERKGYATLQKRRVKEYRRKVALPKKLGTEYAERLTPAMLRDGSWRQQRFRPYDVTVNVPAKSGGRAHFVNDAIAYIKRIWLELGFREMTGNHIQTAFWDLDALFVPQDHPAREMQDTFYLAKPHEQGAVPKALLEKVKAVHEHGGETGSLGWRTPYSEAEAKKLLLRTHTTVLSAQTLAAIKEGQLPLPGKYFAVGTVYRNEALDWKHLFEFHQVEGIVVAEGATFSHLKGYLRLFFGKMGFPDVRIRPAHFPYTEPSAEVDVWDPQKKTWVELGGAGIFRPEVTKTLLGKEVPVLAWGLGLERIITRYYNITDLRELYDNDLERLQKSKVWL